VRPSHGALLVVVAMAVARELPAGEDIYYRKDENGALVLTNVPDHHELRAYSSSSAGGPAGAGEAYRPIIQRIAASHGVHPDLVYAVAAVESNFDPDAVSNKGAQGLMQLMPATAVRFGIRDPFNPNENILGGVRYLRYLLDMFEGDQRLALAAYNAGETVVKATGGVPPYRETRNYVAKVLKLFGPSKTPYVARSRRPPGAAGRGAPAEIYSYTDDDGVTHFSDAPPRETSRPARPATGPR